MRCIVCPFPYNRFMTPITNVFTGQFILACWAIFLVFWFVTSFFTKKTVVNRGGMANGIFIRLAIAIIIVLVIQNRVFPSIGHPLWPYSTLSGTIADIVAACGLILLLWARVTLGGNWSANVVLKENHELIERGPYAVIRHPIYTGVLMLFLGETLWYGSEAWFLIFLGVCYGFWLKAKQEEELLTTHFPIEYPRYRQRTKALIPFVL